MNDSKVFLASQGAKFNNAVQRVIDAGFGNAVTPPAVADALSALNRAQIVAFFEPDMPAEIAQDVIAKVNAAVASVDELLLARNN